MELLLCEKTLAVLQAASCCATLPCLSTANHLPAKARAGEASQQDGTGAVGQTDICLRQILKPPNLNLAENLHPLGPALCKAHGSQALQLCQNTCATPHPARTPAVHRCPGLGFAGCKCEYFQQSGLFCLLAALPSLDRGSCQTIPYSENSVAQCRRSGSCALHPLKEMT